MTELLTSSSTSIDSTPAPWLDVVVPAGDGWIGLVPVGSRFRIVDLEGNQAVDTLFYDAHDPTQRYSAVDTVREQGAAYLTTGSPLDVLSLLPELRTDWEVPGRPRAARRPGAPDRRRRRAAVQRGLVGGPPG